MTSIACLVIVGATIWTPDGPVKGKTLVLKDGRILSIGKAPPKGCTTINAKGGVVTPGLIDVATDIGVSEVGLEASTVDHRPQGRDGGDPLGITASLRVSDAYNPRSSVIPVTRLGGITSVVAAPGGGLIAGQSTWADLAGATQKAAVKRASAAVHVGLGQSEGSRAVRLHRLRAALLEARWYDKNRADVDRLKARPTRLPPDELDALIPAATGRQALAIAVDRASDIEALLRLKEELGLSLIVYGGAEAWLVAAELAAAKVPVVVDPLLYGPESFDRVHASAENAALLAAAGVKVILSAFWGHNARTLPQVAGNAIRAGLPAPVAMKAITEHPADAFGMKDHGRIVVGAVANVVVWTGDPFELSSAPKTVIIGGRRIPMVSRQTQLRDRYLKTTPNGVPSPLPLPK